MVSVLNYSKSVSKKKMIKNQNQLIVESIIIVKLKDDCEDDLKQAKIVV